MGPGVSGQPRWGNTKASASVLLFEKLLKAGELKSNLAAEDKHKCWWCTQNWTGTTQHLPHQQTSVPKKGSFAKEKDESKDWPTESKLLIYSNAERTDVHL